jgi:hypothetical protein
MAMAGITFMARLRMTVLSAIAVLGIVLGTGALVPAGVAAATPVTITYQAEGLPAGLTSVMARHVASNQVAVLNEDTVSVFNPDTFQFDQKVVYRGQQQLNLASATSPIAYHYEIWATVEGFIAPTAQTSVFERVLSAQQASSGTATFRDVLKAETVSLLNQSSGLAPTGVERGVPQRWVTRYRDIFGASAIESVNIDFRRNAPIGAVTRNASFGKLTMDVSGGRAEVCVVAGSRPVCSRNLGSIGTLGGPAITLDLRNTSFQRNGNDLVVTWAFQLGSTIPTGDLAVIASGQMESRLVDTTEGVATKRLLTWIPLRHGVTVS